MAGAPQGAGDMGAPVEAPITIDVISYFAPNTDAYVAAMHALNDPAVKSRVWLFDCDAGVPYLPSAPNCRCVITEARTEPQVIKVDLGTVTVE